MTVPAFIREGAVIIVDDPAKAPFFQGAWTVNKVDGDMLHLETAHRAEKGFMKTPANAATMRPCTADDVEFLDRYMPVGSEIEIEGDARQHVNGRWKVSSLVTPGDSATTTEVTLRKTTGLVQGVKGAFMKACFDPRTMTVTRRAEPQVSRLKAPSL